MLPNVTIITSFHIELSCQPYRQNFDVSFPIKCFRWTEWIVILSCELKFQFNDAVKNKAYKRKHLPRSLQKDNVNDTLRGYIMVWTFFQNVSLYEEESPRIPCQNVVKQTVIKENSLCLINLCLQITYVSVFGYFRILSKISTVSYTFIKSTYNWFHNTDKLLNDPFCQTN